MTKQELNRNYKHFDRNLDNLQGDIYDQPSDDGHTILATHAIDWWTGSIGTEKEKVLDIGCGQGFCKPILESYNKHWFGLTRGNDYRNLKIEYPHAKAYDVDMTFTSFFDDHFDLLFARHTLEHSPFPLLTLMEWRRIGKNLLLVAPAPEFWEYYGKNHYAVMNHHQIWWLLRRAGWEIQEWKTLMSDNPLFVESYRIEEKDRSKVTYPGSPKAVEYWYRCIQGNEIKE